MEIKEILAKYDTDKEAHHHYGDIYNEIFSRFNSEDKLDILEIGTQKGGSLLAWKEYFPNSDVWGVDIVDVVPEKYRLETVTRVISDIKDWKNDKKWDIIIDDGSHFLGDLIFVLSQYVIKLKVGGVMIIEDVRNSKLLFDVMANLFTDIKLIFPDFSETSVLRVKDYDKRRKGAEESFIVAIFKDEK